MLLVVLEFLFLNNLLQNTVRCVRKTIIVTRKLNAKTGGVCAKEELLAMGNTVVVCYSTNISTEAHVPTPRLTPRYGQYLTHAHNHTYIRNAGIFRTQPYYYLKECVNGKVVKG